MSRHRDYELWVHWKQGDDLCSFLDKTGDSKRALLAWAKFMEDNAKSLRRLVEIFKDKELNVDSADTHHISLSGDENILDQAVKENILNLVEFEDDDDYNDSYEEPYHAEKEKARKIKRNCFNCRRELNFNDFCAINLKNYSKLEVLNLWSSDNLKFFCCNCIEQLKCKECSSKLVPFVSDGEIYLYYCSDCLNNKINELTDFLKKNDNELLIEKILDLVENCFINMREMK